MERLIKKDMYGEFAPINHNKVCEKLYFLEEILEFYNIPLDALQIIFENYMHRIDDVPACININSAVILRRILKHLETISCYINEPDFSVHYMDRNFLISELYIEELKSSASILSEEIVISELNLIKIEDLGLSTGLYNCLRRSNIETLDQILDHDVFDFMRIRNFGIKKLEELNNVLISHGYSPLEYKR